MSDQELTLAMKLALDGRSFADGLRSGSRELHNFGEAGKESLEKLNESVEKVKGTLEKIGIGLGAYELIKDASQLDRQLHQVGIAANASQEDLEAFKGGLFRVGREMGVSTQELTASAAQLTESGDDLKETLSTLEAISAASKVTGVDLQTMGQALQDASSLWKINLHESGAAMKALNEMTVAGTLGRLRGGGMARIFESIGPAAQQASLSYGRTLALTEVMSQAEPNARRLAPMEAGILSLFGDKNMAQLGEISFMSGVRVAGAGGKRDPVAVLQDLQKKYLAQGSEINQDAWMARIFSRNAPEAIPGLTQLFKSGGLDKVNEYAKKIENPGNFIQDNVPRAQEDLLTQTERLKVAFEETTEVVVGPLATGLAHIVDWNNRMADKAGHAQVAPALAIGEIAATIGGATLLKKYGGKFLGSLGGTAAGVAEGKVLEQAAGITPVFVTNWPGSGGAGGGGPVSEAIESVAGGALGGKAIKGASATLRLLRAASVGDLLAGTLGAGGLALGAAGVGVAGAAGWGAGRLIDKVLPQGFDDAIGEAIARAFAKIGSKEDKAALARNKGNDVNGTLRIEIDSSGAARVAKMNTKGGLDFDVATGPYFMGMMP